MSDEHTQGIRPGIDVDIQELIGLRLMARGLETVVSRQARSALAGQHISRFRGRGMDYLESRAYLPGDDIRNMDWKLTARTGKAHTKLFHEERQRPVLLLLDTHAGMFFGSQQRLKSVQAARLAALLGWTTIRRGDRIGAFAYGGTDAELKPRGGQRGVMSLIRAVAGWYQPRQQPLEGDEPLDMALLRLRRVIRPGSLVVLVSDLFHLGSEAQRHLNRIRKHNDVLAIRLRDRLECALPPPGRYPVTDGEHRGMLDLGQTRVRRQWQQVLDQHDRDARALMLSCRVPMIEAQPQEPLRDVLLRARGVLLA